MSSAPEENLRRKLQELIDGLAMIDDSAERLTVIVERARKQPRFSAAERTEANRVHGCVSIVWLIGAMHGDQAVFRSDADSPVVRGLLALLCEFFSGVAAAEIAASDIHLLDALGVAQNLSATRRNGLAAAQAAIQAFARAQGISKT